MRALGRSITRRSGLSSLLMTGEMGRLDMISMVGPSFSGITLTERIITAGGDVRPACAPDWAAAGKEMRTPTTWQTRTSWGPMRDKTSFPKAKGSLGTISLGGKRREVTNKVRQQDYDSERNSYSSITAATATLSSALLLSTRTTLPLQRTRMLSVRVISGGRTRVNSMAEPAAIAEST